MTSTPEKLAACPFCGRTDDADNAVQESALAVQQFKSPAGGLAYRVSCVCGASADGHRLASDAITAWNRRALATPDGEGREVLAAEVEVHKLCADLRQLVRTPFESDIAARAAKMLHDQFKALSKADACLAALDSRGVDPKLADLKDQLSAEIAAASRTTDATPLERFVAEALTSDDAKAKGLVDRVWVVSLPDARKAIAAVNAFASRGGGLAVLAHADTEQDRLRAPLKDGHWLPTRENYIDAVSTFGAFRWAISDCLAASPAPLAPDLGDQSYLLTALKNCVQTWKALGPHAAAWLVEAEAAITRAEASGTSDLGGETVAPEVVERLRQFAKRLTVSGATARVMADDHPPMSDLNATINAEAAHYEQAAADLRALLASRAPGLKNG